MRTTSCTTQGANGSIRQLTEGAFIHGSAVWAHDGKRVAFYGNDRDTLSYDVYVADVTGTAAPALLVGGHQDIWYPLDWSFDDSKLLVWKFTSTADSALYAADTTTGTVTPIEAGKSARRHQERALRGQRPQRLRAFAMPTARSRS